MKTNKISPTKNVVNECEPNSPSKFQKGSSKNTEVGTLKKNLSYHETTSLLKKLPGSETMPVKFANSKLPSISCNHGRSSNEISLSAHFPKTIVSKIEFNGEDIFKNIEKKRVLSTQRIEKKKKPYLI
jgi:hypothetical protein